MRYTTYHCGKAVIKEKNKLSEAIEKLAEFEEKEKCGEWLDAIELAKIAIALQSQKWIPCSERLPEKNKLVLGWYKDNPFSGYTYGIVMKTKMGWVFDYGNRYCSNVAAWMPLPEPYREVTDKENLESRR